jgi:hypothetical protein
MCDVTKEAHVIFGSEIYVREIGFGRLVKYLCKDSKRKSIKVFDKEVAESALVDQWWHSDDDLLQIVDSPLKVTAISSFQLLKSGKSIEMIRTEIENNPSALAAWDLFIEDVQVPSITPKNGHKEEESDEILSNEESEDEEYDE